MRKGRIHIERCTFFDSLTKIKNRSNSQNKLFDIDARLLRVERRLGEGTCDGTDDDYCPRDVGLSVSTLFDGTASELFEVLPTSASRKL